MSHFITSVDPGSPAARAGIRAGWQLVRIGGEIVIDILDYEALSAERRLTLELRDPDGKMRTVRVAKPEYAPLGLNLRTPMMSGTRMCCNKCLFCFVDQLPGGVRPTMRVKDDDWRLSLMTGSYVTLTNVSAGIHSVCCFACEYLTESIIEAACCACCNCTYCKCSCNCCCENYENLFLAFLVCLFLFFYFIHKNLPHSVCIDTCIFNYCLLRDIISVFVHVVEYIVGFHINITFLSGRS